jgi:hypothetical protein
MRNEVTMYQVILFFKPNKKSKDQEEDESPRFLNQTHSQFTSMGRGVDSSYCNRC